MKKGMVQIYFDDDYVYVAYDGGVFQRHKLTNGWLWVIGAIVDGGRVSVVDDRKELENHQHRLTNEDRIIK